MPAVTETVEQNVQTDDWTEEKGVVTDEDWQHIMRSVKEQSVELAAECESLEKQQAADEAEHKACIENLEKMRDEEKQQHKDLINKIELVREKLELNNNKSMRKNFTTKIEELTTEKERHRKANNKLAQELEEAERKLMKLTEEQQNEKLSWEKEIDDLQHEKDRVSRLAEEANQAALKDEIALVESQRELAMSEIDDWISDAEKYLSSLRLDPSQNHRHRIEWEKNVALVRTSVPKLQVTYSEDIKTLQKGQQLGSLPKVDLPLLPPVPVIPLTSFPPQLNPLIRPPVVLPPQFLLPHRITPPPHPVILSQNPPPFLSYPPEHNMHRPRPAVPATTRPPPMPYAHSTLPYPTPAAPAPNPGPVTPPPSNPQPAGKLDKLLEKLGAQFPQCTRPQLMQVLQQIKSERGTMAGMSIDDIKQQMEQKLAQNERPALGPIAPPAGSRHFSAAPQRGPVQSPPVQAPAPHVFPSRASQPTPPVRKLCLMCQNLVEPGTQYNTNCPHTLHKECISVWLQTSKNNSCPFCSSK
ncbi:RING finger protein 214 [Trichomycterus rosablanca]|uniref:RING finger protein 214 n=1 Tax=Trichomycterus rosablanca TaxID=2290929 RepID=UPI002F360568